MLLLCIDTSTPQVAVAVGSDDEIIGRVALTRPQHHAEHLAPAIAYLFDQLDIQMSQLSAIGVGIGPGLFTGLRVGVATAKVMAQTLRIPLVAVPSLDLLAFEVRYTDRLIVVMIDARRGEVFHSSYRQVPGGVQRLSDYAVSSPADLATDLAAKGEEVLLVGDGAVRYAEHFCDLERSETGTGALCYPSPSALVELARAKFLREDFCQPRQVHPMYLRLSDAELNWARTGR